MNKKNTILLFAIIALKSLFAQTPVVDSLKKAIAICPKDEDVYVIGGGEIYKQTLPLANKIYLTLVHTEIDGDTYFEYDDSNWKVAHTEFIPKDEKNEFNSTYIVLERENS